MTDSRKQHILINAQDNQIKQQEVTLTYNGSSYVGTATVTGIPMDSYTVRIELNNSLLKVIPGVVKLKNDTTTSTPQVTLVMGNIENSNGYHNVLDILDYNAFLKCFNGPCTGADKQLSDLVIAMRDGEAYVDVHTQQNPNGEIRGQIMISDSTSINNDDIL